MAEFVYDIVIGWVYVFDVFHVKEGPTRIKNAAFYTLILTEMIVLLVAWDQKVGENRVHAEKCRFPLRKLHFFFLFQAYSFDEEEFVPYFKDWFRAMTLTVVPLFFVLGLLSMGAYYRWQHPEGRMPDKAQKASIF